MGFIIFLVRSLIRIILWIILGLRLTLPWVFRSVWFVIRLMALSVISLFVGVPTTIDRISHHWVSSAIQNGVPMEYDQMLYNMVAVVTFFLLLLGWFTLVSLTVFGTTMIFRAVML